MSKKEKLLARLLEMPKDFSFDELETLLHYLGYSKREGSGSRVKFVKKERVISIHKPHPGKIVKRYVLEYVLDQFRKDGIL